MSLKKHATDFSYLFTASIVGQGLRMARSFVVARLIGPLMFGTIQGLGIFLLYIPVIQLGYFQSTNREVPQLLGAGRKREVGRIENNGFWVAIFAGLIGVCIYLGVFLAKYRALTRPTQICWILFAIVLCLQPLTQFYQMLYSAHGKFVTISKISLGYSVVFSFLLLLVFWWGYIGQLISLGLGAALFLLLMILFHRANISFNGIDFLLIRNMIRKGFPILLSTLTFNLFFSVDRLFIIGVKGIEQYGYYALGVALFQVAMVVPESIRQIAYRHFNIEHGKNSAESRLKADFWHSFFMVCLVMWIISVAGYHIAPWLIRWFLPKYLPSIEIVKAFCFAMNFVGPGLLLSNALYAVYLQKRVLGCYLASILLFVALAFSVTHYNLPTYTVAIAMAIAHATCWLLMLILIIHTAEYRVESHWLRKFFVSYICLGLYSLLFTIGVDLFHFTHTIQGTVFTLLVYITVLILSGWFFRNRILQFIRAV